MGAASPFFSVLYIQMIIYSPQESPRSSVLSVLSMPLSWLHPPRGHMAGRGNTHVAQC